MAANAGEAGAKRRRGRPRKMTTTITLPDEATGKTITPHDDSQ